MFYSFKVHPTGCCGLEDFREGFDRSLEAVVGDAQVSAGPESVGRKVGDEDAVFPKCGGELGGRRPPAPEVNEVGFDGLNHQRVEPTKGVGQRDGREDAPLARQSHGLGSGVRGQAPALAVDDVGACVAKHFVAVSLNRSTMSGGMPSAIKAGTVGSQ